ncbi:alkaline phosphatase family protein [Acetonema longum]|uniref:Type I phosphodiesterase/nucleotide pyrophosphatase n=1 Tax=Acetonema longum DSM 6540 TaxID=1009370 RepID=F7NIB1_9FIRM|nr:ectonucleotide pyrophosphatase/phosphodiesterase [Acetonema longum]EGO64217.1 type I phosphodiesterase/nucleotide pyrophosphatase [Acetonema longum DSM 6540]
MSQKTLIIVIDGCAADYITPEDTPNLYRLGQAGFYSKIKSAIPSVTNVNHASILSGSFPDRHGVVGNYYYDRATGSEGFIEDSRHMKAQSVIDMYSRQGKSTALLTVKGKVLEVFGANARIGINLQKPEPALLKRLDLDTPPGVASFEAYDWIFKACYQVLSRENPDLVYCTTNDYMMHNYAPGSPEAKKVMQTMDRWIGRIYDLDPAREIYITADHGMNKKSRLIDLQKKLDMAGFNTFCLLPLKDRYLENHRCQEGGAVYVYVLAEGQIPKVLDYLKGCDFIDRFCDKAAAAEEFNLPADNIGDIVVLSNQDSAFAELTQDERCVETRTHGSLHEREIPLIAVNARKEAEYYQCNSDIVRFILESIS